MRQRRKIPFRRIARTAIHDYPKRTILGIALFVGQAFMYNAVTFDLGTLLSTFFKVSAGAVPFYIVAYAAGNFLGPFLLGRLFDTVGRRPMITATYLTAAALAVVLGQEVERGTGGACAVAHPDVDGAVGPRVELQTLRRSPRRVVELGVVALRPQMEHPARDHVGRLVVGAPTAGGVELPRLGPADLRVDPVVRHLVERRARIAVGAYGDPDRVPSAGDGVAL